CTTDFRGRAGVGHGRLHWTANFDEVHDFEGQIRSLAGGRGLLSDAQFASSSDPLGRKKAGMSKDLDALAAYVTSLSGTASSPFAIGNAAKAGEAAFKKANCAACHSGKTFQDGKMHDIGTLKASSGKASGKTLSGIDTPTLRGLWDGGPYLHDGSANSLVDAIKAHKGVKLSSAEINNLAEYLKAIDGRIKEAPKGTGGPIDPPTPPEPPASAPTTTISTQSLTVTGNFSVSIKFSKAVTGFAKSDIKVTNATVASVSSLSGTEYFASVTPRHPGSIRINVPANVAQDSARKGNLASNSITVSYNEKEIPKAKPEGAVLTLTTGNKVKHRFSKAFSNPVVFATIERQKNHPPMVARISNLTNNDADVEVRYQRIDGKNTPVSGVKVHILVLEEGLYTKAKDGVTMEVRKVDVLKVASRKTGWQHGTRVRPSQKYANPVVIGQVLTERSDRWSHFWSRGRSTSLPVKNTDLQFVVGIHTGEDPNPDRPKGEQVGYLVIEAGTGKLNGVDYEAGVLKTTDNSRASTPLKLKSSVSGDSRILLSVSGMRGNNGAVPTISARQSNGFTVELDEDKLKDSEMFHISESVGYLFLKK
ncbi:MAG: Ig-like domain-containing protein, partial [Verrucomicrobiota bacterium]